MVFTFGVDHYVSRRQTAMLTARRCLTNRRPARVLIALCCSAAAPSHLLMLAMLGMAIFASFASFWLYNLTPSLHHYVLGLVDGEVGEGFTNSLKMAGGTALFGTPLVFFGAYPAEKTKGAPWLRGPVKMLAMLLMAVPGLVLGLGYIFFQRARQSVARSLSDHGAAFHPLHNHSLYTTGISRRSPRSSRWTASLKRSAPTKVPWFRTFWRVTC